jgi:hypothetical protein
MRGLKKLKFNIIKGSKCKAMKCPLTRLFKIKSKRFLINIKIKHCNKNKFLVECKISLNNQILIIKKLLLIKNIKLKI